MVGWRRGADPEARRRARDQARWLVRDHGNGAEEALEEKLRRKTSSAALREIYRRTRRELHLLRRQQERDSNPPGLWHELLRRLRSLIRRKPGRRRRHRR